MQAQWPPAPYVGLWTRLDGFRRPTLERAVLRGDVLKPSVMRGTLHLVTARDYPLFYAAFKEMNSWFGPASARARERPRSPTSSRLLRERPHHARGDLRAPARDVSRARRDGLAADGARGAPARASHPRARDRGLDDAAAAVYELVEAPAEIDARGSARRDRPPLPPRVRSGDKGRHRGLVRPARARLRARARRPSDPPHGRQGRELFDVPRAPLPGRRAGAGALPAEVGQRHPRLRRSDADHLRRDPQAGDRQERRRRADRARRRRGRRDLGGRPEGEGDRQPVRASPARLATAGRQTKPLAWKRGSARCRSARTSRPPAASTRRSTAPSRWARSRCRSSRRARARGGRRTTIPRASSGSGRSTRLPASAARSATRSTSATPRRRIRSRTSARSRALRNTTEVAAAIGAHVVFHVGSHLGAGLEAGMEQDRPRARAVARGCVPTRRGC